MSAPYHSSRSPDSSIDGVARPAFSTGADARPTHFNQAWLDLRGATLEEELDRPLSALVHPGDVGPLLDAMTRALAKNAPEAVEFRVPGRAGAPTGFLGLIAPRGPMNAEAAGLAVHAFSAGERMRFEGALREYAAVTRATAAGVVVSDPDLRIRSWNEGARTLLGYVPEEVVGQYPDAFADDEALGRLHAARERLLRGDPSAYFSLGLRRADGVVLPCEALFSPVPGPEGGVEGVVVVFHDATARKLDELARLQAEDELLRAHRDIDAMLRTLPAPAIVVGDADGVVVNANDAFRALAGEAADEIVGQPVTRLFKYWDEEGDELLDYTLRRLRQGGSFACRLRRPDGRTLELSVTAQSLMFMNQKVHAAHCADLTRQKSNERALAAAVAALEETRAAKTEVLARVGRELRTPLNGVLGGVELALESPDLPEDLRSRLQRILESARALVAVSKNLMDASDPVAAGGEVVRVAFDLADVLAESEASARPAAAEKGVTLYLHAEPAPPGPLYGDPGRLRQVLSRLLANAVRNTGSGVVKLMAETEDRPGDHAWVHFAVVDSGEGMDSQTLQELLRGADGPGGKFRDSDLASTGALIESMGGFLYGESAPGHGTRFDFGLQFDLDRRDAPGALPRRTAGGDIAPPRFAGSALVAEDDAVNREVVEERLRRAGLDVTLAVNGAEAVEAVRRRMAEGAEGGGFDIVFMDIQMPVMDGLEATRRLRAMGLRAPVVALTANVLSIDRLTYRKQGLDGYLPKPFAARELWDCLAEYLKPPPGEGESVTGTGSGAGEGAPGAPGASEPGGRASAGEDALQARLRLRFAEEYRDAARRLDGFAGSGDWDAARLLTHSIKSSSALVGAADLSAFAATLEDGYRRAGAASAPAPDAAQRRRFAELLDECLATLDAVIAATAVFADHGGAAPEAGGSVGSAGSSREAAREAAARLARHLAAGDPRGFEDAGILADALGRGRADVAELLKRVGDYDFEEARAVLERIRAGLDAEAERGSHA